MYSPHEIRKIRNKTIIASAIATFIAAASFAVYFVIGKKRRS